MSIESERPQLPFAEKFAQGITTKVELWDTIVDDSNVEDDMKIRVKEALSKLRDHGLTQWQSLDDAFYGTISAILTITESWKKKNEAATVLFDTLRDDLWSFHKEVTS